MKEKRKALFKALPETVDNIVRSFQGMDEDEYLEMEKNTFPDQAIMSAIKKNSNYNS